jgi:purine-binding chemotaxis protein CheW
VAFHDKTMDILNLQFVGAGNENQQMIFNLGPEEFGIEILKVQEIIRFVKPVKVPKAPECVAGVINFRGDIIPVLNLRQIFGLEPLKYDEFTVIIIVKSNEKTFGMIVDSVSDIIAIPEANIQPSEFSAKERTKYLKAMVKLENRLVLMLDLDKVVDFDKIEASLQPSANPSDPNGKSRSVQ